MHTHKKISYKKDSSYINYRTLLTEEYFDIYDLGK